MPFGSCENPMPVHWKLLLTPDGRCILNSGKSEKTNEWKSPAVCTVQDFMLRTTVKADH